MQIDNYLSSVLSVIWNVNKIFIVKRNLVSQMNKLTKFKKALQTFLSVFYKEYLTAV